MNILIVGCGRVGAHLARVLEEEGHDVSILAEHEEDMELLLTLENYSFEGYSQVGSPIDVDMLRTAGIENCEAVVAVCPQDNINIMVAQIAERLFHVPRVLARIGDPSRKRMFAERMSMRAVCPTNLTAEALLHGLLDEDRTMRVTIGSSTMAFLLADPLPEQINHPLSYVKAPAGHSLYGVLRANGTVELNIMPGPLLHTGDKIIYSCIAD